MVKAISNCNAAPSHGLHWDVHAVDGAMPVTSSRNLVSAQFRSFLIVRGETWHFFWCPLCVVAVFQRRNTFSFYRSIQCQIHTTPHSQLNPILTSEHFNSQVGLVAQTFMVRHYVHKGGHVSSDTSILWIYSRRGAYFPLTPVVIRGVFLLKICRGLGVVKGHTQLLD